VARQRSPVAPRRQARPKGPPGVNKILQGLILKMNFKKVKIKKLCACGRSYGRHESIEKPSVDHAFNTLSLFLHLV
jgi:hypothetical protein